MHAGKTILGSMSANCIPQDETAVLCISGKGVMDWMSAQQQEETEARDSLDSGMKKHLDQLPTHTCQVKSCKVCSATLSYIGGFFTMSLQQEVKCNTCRLSLFHNKDDSCPERSLILMKNYYSDHRGLKYPSGSLCNLLYHAERIFRTSSEVMGKKHAPAILLHRALLSLDNSIFEDLQLAHSVDTADGTENHFTSLIHLILKKYLALRLKKVHQDQASQKKAHGNYLHRSRIFQNM